MEGEERFEFEEVMFGGLLTMVFHHLYALQISIATGSTNFSSFLVNKRWSKLFRHPLQVFIDGRYESQLKHFPPSYYSDYGEWVLYPISESGAMTLQISSVPEGDDEWEQFVIREMILFPFKLTDECPNNKVRRVAEALADPICGYEPLTVDFERIKSVADYNMILRWMRRCGIDDLSREDMLSVVKQDKQLALYLMDNGIITLNAFEESEMTKELCTKAMLNGSGMALQYVPRHLITSELVEIAVRECSSAISFVPEEMMTEELCVEAVRSDPSVLVRIPVHKITQEMCNISTQRYGWTLDSVPHEMVTEEMCNWSVSVYPHVLTCVPERFMTAELCTRAVMLDASAVGSVPEHLLTPEMKALENLDLFTDDSSNSFVSYQVQSVTNGSGCERRLVRVIGLPT